MKSGAYSLSIFVDKSKSRKIVFCGSDEIALPMLEYLNQLQAISLAGVLSQPDRRSGRGKQLKANPIKQWAKEKDLDVRTPQSPTKYEIDWIKEIDVDLVLVMAYGHILNQAFLDCTPLGCYNLHASLLPAYRGASPIETSLAIGEKTTGVTLMRMVMKMDAGPIIGQEKVTISQDDLGSTLRTKLAEACIPLIINNLEALLSGNRDEKLQIEEYVTYCRKLKKEDSHLDFSLDAKQLACRVRAFHSWPGSMFFHNETSLRVGSCKALDDQGLKPGEIRVERSELFIGTAKGSLQILQMQKPGGKMLSTPDFLRGYSLKSGTEIKFFKSEPLISKNFN